MQLRPISKISIQTQRYHSLYLFLRLIDSMPTRRLSKAVIQEMQCSQNFCSYAKHRWSNILQQHRVWSRHSFRGFKTNSMPSYVNPLIELQKYVSIPIIPPEEAVFSPTEEEVFHATKIFTSSRVGSEEAVRFVGTYINGAEMPESSLPEVCKLYLIQCLLFK